MEQPVRVGVVGAGGRGSGYAEWIAAHPDRASLVAVADPSEVRRERLADGQNLPGEARFSSWIDLADAHLDLDAVLICTQDAMHTEPALRFLAEGYHVLLEKPMAPTPAECVRIAAAARASGRVFAVAHVLRYTPYTRLLRRLLAGDVIGEIVSVQHLEPVGWFHQAHSFVRGNWRREDESSSMLMAKSCHDVDWLGFVVGRPITSVSSFGGLAHFTRAHQPAGAADRCLDCHLQRTCAYSATRIYLDRALAGETGWPLPALTDEVTAASIERALSEGPYGRCVYACDNDVVDHQVVAMTFAGGITGTFTMTAFTDMGFRRTSIFGTQGELFGDGERVEVFDFRTQQRRVIEVAADGDATAGGGHGGGDDGLMDDFIAACAAGDPGLVSSGADATLTSHLAVFAAERARREARVVEVDAERAAAAAEPTFRTS